MLPHVGALMGTRLALSQIANYVHHQSADRYDMLRSNARLLAADQRLSTKEFQDVHEVAQRYFRLIIIDSSNDESSYTYLDMLDAADVIVVSTTPEPDRTENAVQLMTQLAERNDHGRDLAEQVIVLISNDDPAEGSAAEVQRIGARFAEDHAQQLITTVPYDRAVRQMVLRFESLSPASQRAWLRAGGGAGRTNRGRRHPAPPGRLTADPREPG